MASKGISPAIRALARISRATPAPSRLAYSQAQPFTLRQALSRFSTTNPIPTTPRTFTRALSSTPSRRDHTDEAPPPPTNPNDLRDPKTPRQPSYELTFTCVPCGTRSAHTISKQGYHHGSVLIACPSCRNRHIISDHLKIFGHTGLTVEDLMREKGMLVKRGTLGEDGDLEFWEDGSTTRKSERQGEGEGLDPTPKARSQPAAEAAEGDAPGSSFGKA